MDICFVMVHPGRSKDIDMLTSNTTSFLFILFLQISIAGLTLPELGEWVPNPAKTKSVLQEGLFPDIL